ncbi:MAG: hypothetical protein NVS3B10_15340 [Polyangiales bacterium]
MRRVAQSLAVSTLSVLAISTLLGGCSDRPKYKPEPAYSGQKASLPKVPPVPGPATWKNGSNWTIYGVQHSLSNPRHRKEVDNAVLTLDGFVVDVYRPQEPAGKEGCVYPNKAHPPTSKQPYPPKANCDEKGGPLAKIQPPHFSIADKADEKNPAKWVTVMGYASSFIQAEMACDCYKTNKCKMGSTKEDDLALDNNYSSNIVYLGEPKLGSKITVTGLFGTRYSEGSQPTGPLITPFGVIDVTSAKKGKLACADCGITDATSAPKVDFDCMAMFQTK